MEHCVAYRVLYTRHLTKKAKTYIDGFLQVKEKSSTLYDENGKYVSSSRLPAGLGSGPLDDSDVLSCFEGLLVNIDSQVSPNDIPKGAAAGSKCEASRQIAAHGTASHPASSLDCPPSVASAAATSRPPACWPIFKRPAAANPRQLKVFKTDASPAPRPQQLLGLGKTVDGQGTAGSSLAPVDPAPAGRAPSADGIRSGEKLGFYAFLHHLSSILQPGSMHSDNWPCLLKCSHGEVMAFYALPSTCSTCFIYKYEKKVIECRSRSFGAAVRGPGACAPAGRGTCAPHLAPI